jgi:SAM-dependent methyltransferase
VCAAGHTFDVARAGYVNLLQPQDRKSLDAGDSREAVAARAALLAAGVGQGVVQTVAHALGALTLADEAVVVDVGAGTGDVLGVAAARWASTAIGIDLSTAAAEHAARRFPASTWVVANADRRLPLLDHSVDVLLSIHARRLPDEAARVLKPSGALIVAVPGADDLIELRAMVQGEGLPSTAPSRWSPSTRRGSCCASGRVCATGGGSTAHCCSRCCGPPIAAAAAVPPRASRRSITSTSRCRPICVCSRRSAPTPARDANRAPHVGFGTGSINHEGTMVRSAPREPCSSCPS